MTIKTKFDIGDKVFTLGASNNGKPYVRHGIIDSIDLRVDETGGKYSTGHRPRHIRNRNTACSKTQSRRCISHT